ncbi:hypothetical protein HWV62_32922, partial [Athelia sp. TMB]
KWDHMMDQTHVMYYYWQQPMANTLPPISRVQPKKQALPGPMRISPEGTLGAWPGDNPNQCAQGYNCPEPTVYLDAYTPSQQRYFDVGAGGPYPFTFTAVSNATWLKLTPSKGSISPTNTEIRVEATVDWSKLSGAEQATINFTASAPGQPLQLTQAYFIANHTVAGSGLLGFVEGDGGISIEAAHATRNTTVSGVTWTELPGYGKTISGVTPWPRTGNNGKNFTIGSGPALEYDFFNFNTVDGSHVNITVLVSPSFNANGDDQPLTFAVQVDSQAAQSLQPMPVAVPGGTPAGWDGFVANSIIAVNLTAVASPGAHTLKACSLTTLMHESN